MSFLLSESLVHAHISDLYADADQRRLAHGAHRPRRSWRFRTVTGRVLVRTGLRLARIEGGHVAATIDLNARPRSDAASRGAPVAPRRRAA